MTADQKENLKTLKAMLKERGLEKEEVTRYRGEYWLLHICRNGAPVPLFHSTDANEIKKQIELMGED